MKKRLFDPDSTESFLLSRSKIDLFCQCPRCFYLDRKLGVSPPGSAPYTLNNAVDALLKMEFDEYRVKGSVHPFTEKMGLNAVPFSHPNLENWRNNRIGIQYFCPKTNFLLYGAIDDVWQLPSGKLVIVDYKAKATQNEITLKPKRKKNGEIVKTDRYLISYAKQIEFYQWLFRMNGFEVSNTGYFVFANALKDRDSFDDRLDFKKVHIPYEGNDSWVEPTLFSILECLKSETLPAICEGCDHCTYRIASQAFESTALTIG
ncbi:MAG: hypothetical protein K1000chlam3_00014 [Chlamydiae bacterium]|nr:hypothetical protein [Chlamydiota bacterium]